MGNNRENDDLFAEPRIQPAGRDVRAYLADTKNKRAAAAAADKNKLQRASSSAKFCQQRNGIMALAPPTKTNKIFESGRRSGKAGKATIQRRATRIICQKTPRSWQSSKTYPSDTLPSRQSQLLPVPVVSSRLRLVG